MTASKPSASKDRIAVALDLADLDDALRLAERVAPFVGVFKVGLELFVRFGPNAVERVRQVTNGGRVFLDLKLHDIPETVERAVASARASGASLLTVHASGGRAMLEAASRAAGDELRLLAVTVLTSLDASDLRDTGVERPVEAQAEGLFDLAWAAGVRGFVTSTHEAPRLRTRQAGAYLVTPGIRPSGSSAGDQKRIATPAAAVAAGADLLVIGRPIRDAADPAEAASAICRELDNAT
ncbi:MAG: orotidine-5'-phosphate decarboxylase [Polyangiaceae bacterium]|nr:orotidine-5'-phosphate decarboxylase [Polyangiaceae bacterium]